jgi:hypothetical protein
MFYRILIPLFALFMILRMLSNYKRGRRTRKEVAFWLVFWSGFAYVGYHPDLLSRGAQAIGFETGSNALFAFCILLLFYGFGRLMMIVEQMEVKLTELVRKETLEQLDEQSR